MRRNGLAKVVDPDFENNALGLRREDEVYVLADWELLYSHAWANGAEVEGGLPVRDKSYFRVVQEPKIQHWIRGHTNSAPTTIWWLKLDGASRDTQTIKSCEREGF
jgi:hypothetical protein